MKRWAFMVAFLAFGLLGGRLAAGVPSGYLDPSLHASDKKIVILIHGWTAKEQPLPQGYDHFSESSEWTLLRNNLLNRLYFSGTRVFKYRWEQDASTGYIYSNTGTHFTFIFTHATEAAFNAVLNGNNLADMLNVAPDLREVTFVAHSAGSWVAYMAARKLLERNKFVIVNVVLLDPFIPGMNPSTPGTLTKEQMSLLGSGQGSERIFRLENYFSYDASDRLGHNATSLWWTRNSVPFLRGLFVRLGSSGSARTVRAS